MSMYTFAINFISEENPTFCSRTRSPLSPATCEHSAHSPSRQVSQAAGTGHPPRQACVSVRPRTEQFLKLCTVCKHHLPAETSSRRHKGAPERGWDDLLSAAGPAEMHAIILHKDAISKVICKVSGRVTSRFPGPESYLPSPRLVTSHGGVLTQQVPIQRAPALRKAS